MNPTDAERNAVGIILGDCLNVLKSMKRESYDLTITSPPYNLGNDHHIQTSKGRRTFMPYEDAMPESEYQENQIEVLQEIYRVTKESGSLFYNHKNRIKDGVQITPYQWLFKTSWITKQELVWFNRSQNFDKIRFYPMTERIYWLVKSPKTKLFNTISHHDLFDWQAVGNNGLHKRSFPEKMIEDIIKCFPNAKTILDPYAGGGTVGVVAKKMGIEFVLIEKEPKYVEMASQRLREI